MFYIKLAKFAIFARTERVDQELKSSQASSFGDALLQMGFPSRG